MAILLYFSELSVRPAPTWNFWRDCSETGASYGPSATTNKHTQRKRSKNFRARSACYAQTTQIKGNFSLMYEAERGTQLPSPH